MFMCCSRLFSTFLKASGSASAQRRRFLSQGGLFTGLLASQTMLPAAAQQAPAADVPGGRADLIYIGGDVITVNDRQPEAEAVAVRRGIVVGVGARADIEKQFKGPKTRMVDLAGRTLVPGFIDSHSHMAQHEASWGAPNLSPPPVGGIRNIAQIVDVLKAHIAKKKIPEGQLVLAVGYDDSLLEDKRHPTRADLDKASTKHPILTIHASGHLVAVNSMALAAVKINRDSKDPEGGLIQRTPDGEPNGVLEELAAIPMLSLLKPNPMPRRMQSFLEIQDHYASFGITTAQDGITLPADFALMQEAARQGKIKLDLVCYPRWDLFNDVLAGKKKLDVEIVAPGTAGADSMGAPVKPGEARIDRDAKLRVGVYRNRLKIGGIKITGDGSPQGKTAFLTQPYVKPPPGQKADYRGYATVTQEELDRWFDIAWRNQMQLIVHCNGDAAADMMIAATRKAIAAHGRKDLRPVMIHAQMIRPDQLDAMAETGIFPSFFTSHTFYWGDWHLNETVGPVRAAHMSPAASAARKGMRFGNHSDAPVVPPNCMDLMWTAVNRLSRSGVVVGADQRLTPLQALKAMTLDPAYQYFEEKRKGSIEVGKLADLVILDKNPLKVPPMAIRDIRVLETIKEGRTIYRKA